MKLAFAAPLVLALAACGGGGGGVAGAGGTAASEVPVVSPTPPPGTLVAGSVVEQNTPLSGAVVIAGPVPVTGATPPAQLPAGDVTVVTGAAGTFAATIAVAPAAPSNLEPFVLPQNNVLGIVPPASGYYVEVFAAGTDGKSAGAPLPLHRFLAASAALVLRVSSASAAEAAALAAVNADRVAGGAGTLIFDETAEEAARAHATDATARGAFICHYDANNAGPSSRYLSAGGLGLTGENVGIANAVDATAAFAFIESAFLSEKTATPPGAHYTNLIDASHLWAGLAAAGPSSLPFNFNVDYELVTPSDAGSAVSASGYTAAGCAAGIVNNNS